ncbi:MAG TPA: glycosyltransferase, partial [Methylomirabilota bacterium]|nr:glycosyltransferase [Methylomirabilota bacterium]
MIAAITAITFGILATSSFALLCFGVNLLYLTWSSTRIRKSPVTSMSAGEEPDVCVQIPIYNERYVAERVLDAVCALDWPAGRLEVQVLDDSDDDTTSIIARKAARLRRDGIQLKHV